MQNYFYKLYGHERNAVRAYYLQRYHSNSPILNISRNYSEMFLFDYSYNVICKSRKLEFHYPILWEESKRVCYTTFLEH